MPDTAVEPADVTAGAAAALALTGWHFRLVDPDYATQLATWLTADYHAVDMKASPVGDQDQLVPPPAP